MDTDTRKLDRWAQLLLDTSKRNNLINFKDSKNSTLEILSPEPALLFGKCDGDAVFEVVGPKIKEEKNLDDPLLSQAAPYLEKDEYLSRYSVLVRKPSQLLVWGRVSDPLAVMKVIDKKARSALDETGVNVSYLAFGFVRWREQKEGSPFFLAPLLLVPVSLESKGATSPWHIKLTGDDIVTNPTLSYIMQAEAGVCLPDYGDGESLADYLGRVATLVQPLGWTVSGECKLGIFSFLKMNMYRDMKDNAARILQNGNVRILLGEGQGTAADSGSAGASGTAAPVTAPAAGSNPAAGMSPQEMLSQLHTVVDADSSQLNAIAMARSGKSFVLQGPPGTGKSQTITNIIADCIYNGRKVLFVSEKLAALNVVYDKLKAAGLSDFCLELHSHKSSKKAVIDELCRTLRADRYRLSDRADKELEAKSAAQRQLDSYAAELHKRREGMDSSAYEMHAALAAVRSAPDVPYVVPDIASKGAAYLADVTALLGQYADYTRTVGDDYTQNPWYGYGKESLSYEEKLALQTALSAVTAAMQELIPFCGNVANTYGLTCGSLTDCRNWEEAFSLLARSDVITCALLQKDKFDSTSTTAHQAAEMAGRLTSLKGQLEADFEQGIFQKDGRNWNNKLKKQFSSFFSRLFSKEYKAILTELRLESRSGKKFSYEEAVRATGMLRDWQQMTEDFASCGQQLEEALGAAYKGIPSDWKHIMEDVAALGGLYGRGMDFAFLSDMGTASFDKEKPTFASYAQKLASLRSAWSDGAALLTAGFDPAVLDIEKGTMEAVLEKCAACLADIGTIDNWVSFTRLLRGLEAQGAIPFISKIIEQGIPTASVVDAYRKAFYTQSLHSLISSVPAFASFTRVSQDKAVSVFAEKDKLQFDINKAQIQEKLSALRPSLDMVTPKSPVSVLLREGEKKRKQKSIRTLIAETGDLVQVLKPCFLMSPLSVSMFLSGGIEFDTVVFDEASQIFPQDAVGAVYRGKQLIVVGDSKQMPPSNFFTTTLEVEGDEELDDVTDFESILDMCAPSMPQSSLQWHYRSRYEQLIAFSNRNFYGGSLMTFPSASGGVEGTGVDYYHVDGVFDRKTHTNLAEAERVVELVLEDARRHPDRSLGVVAFSVAQQNLIDSLLARRRSQDPSQEEFFSRDKAEPFFIKNLETVQGDERDTIIFSVAYGKDEQGKLLHNFGPLNRQGGERRLNVAVTRAKVNVQLVSSMHSGDIDLGRTNSEGARLLKEYIDYAERGEKALGSGSSSGQGADGRELEEEIAEFLRSKGYTVETQVGCGSSKIDIAVRRPDGSYALAVECDGENYRTARNTRDRDRLRKEQLGRMGWHYYRVWSTSWFRNKQIEKGLLLRAAELAVSGDAGTLSSANLPASGTAGTGPSPAGLSPAAQDAGFAEVAPEEHIRFPAYREADVTAIAKSYGCDLRNFRQMLLDILAVEAPLSEDSLLRRIPFLFGKEKVTPTVRQLFDQQMAGCRADGIIRRDGFLYLDGMPDMGLRVPGAVRELKNIALEELASGMLTILKHNLSSDKDSLYHKLVTALGFSRSGDAMTARLDAALALLGDAVRVEGNMLSLQLSLHA